ncbi:MAG: NAD-dependent dehydratase, partial [Nanoarchaeota archaeon]
CVQEMGSSSATNILSREEKSKRFIEKGNFVGFTFDIYKEPERLDIVIRSFSPDVIVNLAHIPSGPYSMRDREFASLTLQNNIVGTNNIL